MNYIKKLQSEVESLKKDKREAAEKITDLLIYLDSDKFRTGDELDGYVSIKDVEKYLYSARVHLFPAEALEEREVATPA